MANVVYETKIDSVLKATEAALEKAAESIGERMESHAKLYITAGVYQSPEGWYIRTGNLRNSITHTVQQDKEGTAAIVGSAVDYAPYVELGTGIHTEKGRKTPWKYKDHKGKWHTTSGMPARPFLRPAVENHIKEYQDVLADILKDIS